MKQQRRSRKVFDRKRLSKLGGEAANTYRKYQDGKEKAFEGSLYLPGDDSCGKFFPRDVQICVCSTGLTIAG